MEFTEGLAPVSPSGQYLNSSVLSVSVICVMEAEVPVDDMNFVSLLKDLLLPINPRFSSVMVMNSRGDKQWKKTVVKLDDHVNISLFPTGLSPTSYDECLDNYISQIAGDPFPQDKPLWALHIFKYPTSNAASNIILKLHHSLGDGYSLMGALLSCLRRADNPSAPLTLPSRLPAEQESEHGSIWSRVPRAFSFIFNSISDFGQSMMKSIVVEDDRTPIRSGENGVEYRPISLSTMTFSLDRIKRIKAKLGVTTNDVIIGVIFLGTRLCMQAISHESSKSSSTAVVLLNTGNIRGYKSVQEMVEPNSEAPWGNRYSLLHTSIPKLKHPESSNPLEYVWEAHKIIKMKRSSFAVYLTSRFLETLHKIRGPEAVARYVHQTLKNSSMTISNMIGPIEKAALDNHPIKGLYFMTFGLPQNLTITIMSYMGNVRVGIGIEEGFLDPQKLKSSLENAFEMMLKVADELPTRENQNLKAFICIK